MSWDIVLFSSKEKITVIEDIDSDMLVAVDFDAAFEEHFTSISKDGNSREVKGDGFTIDYFTDDEPVSNKIVSLSGEDALIALAGLARKHNWQLFDTGSGEMLNLNNLSDNGYKDFTVYKTQILENNSKPKGFLGRLFRK